MDRGFTPKQYVNLFTADMADRQIIEFLTREFGTLSGKPRGGQYCTASYN